MVASRTHRRSAVLTLLLTLAAIVAAPASAQAKLTATLTVEAEGDATRVVATLTSDRPVAKRKRPTRIDVSVGSGKPIGLTRAGKPTPTATALGTFRSAKLRGARATAATALVGTRAKLTLISAGGRTTLRATAAGSTPIGGTTPISSPGQNPTPTPAPTGATPTPAPTGPTPTPAPLFAKPATALTGDAAYQAIKGYVANATLTTCPAGWPNCPVEQRTSIANDGSFAWCRLTPNSGSDIRSYGTVTGVVGADQAVDGSWAVSFREVSYGYEHYYTWRVAADGSAAIQYWESQAATAGPPTDTYTGFVWRSGYRDCSY